MYDSSYVKKSGPSGSKQFVPTGDGGVGPGSKQNYPPTKKHVGMSTDDTHTKVRNPWAKGGGNDQVSATYPKKAPEKFEVDKSSGKDQFVPKGKPTYGVGGV